MKRLYYKRYGKEVRFSRFHRIHFYHLHNKIASPNQQKIAKMIMPKHLDRENSPSISFITIQAYYERFNLSYRSYGSYG
jgi:hypothetical protein